MNESHAPLFADVDSNVLLRSLLNVSLTGVILFRPVYNPEGFIVDLAYKHLNPAAQKMLGLSSQPAETFLTLYPHTQQTGIFAFYRDTFLSGVPGYYEVNYSHDGLDNYFHLSAQASGSVLVVSFTDTAQQKRSHVEEALRASQLQERENFYQVFEQAPVIIALLRGPQHFFQYCNPAFQALFPSRVLTGHFYAEVMPEIVAAGLMAELDRVYTTGQTYYGNELPVITTPPDGSAPHQRYYDFSYQAHRENGQIVGISIFAYDVTSRVEARRQEQAQRMQLASLFEQAPVAICVFRGNDYSLNVVNPLMGQMLGRPLDQLIGKPFFEAMPELIDQGLRQLLDEVKKTGLPFLAQEQAIHLAWHQPGEVGYFNYVYQPLREPNGEISGITCIAIEVSEQVIARQQIELSEKQAQTLAKELVAANEELAASNEEMWAANEEIQSTNKELSEANVRLASINGDLDNFIYMASHDLKAPIANIEGLVRMLIKRLPATIREDERLGRLTELIQDSVERFKHTIGSLTDVVKLQKENAQVMELVDLAKVIGEVRLDLSPQIEAAKAVLEISLERGPTVLFSEKNLRSLVYNLLSNAIKYGCSDRTSMVQIASHREGDYLVLSFRDNGLGMDLSKQTKLFTMFGRLHDHVEGSGVGLYMVKKMVENVGGRIEVESQLGQGSTFRVYFPT